MILAGDIGGTNTRLALFDKNGTLTALHEYRSQDHANLEAIIKAYLAMIDLKKPVKRACFGVAGPVKNKPGAATSQITNLSWKVEQKKLARTLEISADKVRIINDLAANAAGIDALGGKQFHVLQKGEKRDGNRGIISAGTGLGVGGSVWDGKRHIPVPSEGGHYSFGPRNELEFDLQNFLAGRDVETFHGYVSWERILSGPGLYNVFEFHVARNIGNQSLVMPPGTTPREAAKLVSAAAMAGTCDRAVRALDLFVSLYGAAAGNVAVQYTAIGGLYVGGGIAPKIIEKLKSPAFLEAYLNKGPMRTRLLEKLPVRVIMDEHCALRGAALEAQR